MQQYQASFYEQIDGLVVKCTLCPHNCKLSENQTGICRIRQNVGGELVCLGYGKICSLASDPVEKKPLYHFYPGKPILSVGSVGCNFRCDFCQNWEISQCNINESHFLNDVSAEYLLKKALEKENNIGLAYTYNEPFINFEFMYATARLIRSNGLKNVMVTNGYFNREPLMELLNIMDAFNVDMKAFSEDFYKTRTKATLQPVLETIKTIAASDCHLEITNLVIPGQNDNPAGFEKMVRWIADECGNTTALHLSRYFPRYKLNEEITPEETLLTLYEIAKKYLDFVYLGNISTKYGQDSACPSCQSVLVRRNGYMTKVENLKQGGKCAKCGFSTGIVYE